MAMASGYTTSAGGKRYTFTLRSGMKFHDGSPVTAKDVVFTLDRIKKLKTGIYSEVAAYASSKALSATKVQIDLSRPYTPFVGALSRVYILNSKLVSQHLGSDGGQSWLANNDAGSGPFTLDSYSPNQSANFTAFPGYYRGPAKSKEVQYKFISEAATQKALLESGDADIAMNIAKRDIAGFKSNPKFRVDAADTPVQLYIYFNTAGGPTKDKRVREALSYAYDYSTHIKDILDGYGKPAKGPLPQPLPCWDPSVQQPTFNLAKARSLLAQAGVHNLTLKMEYLPALEEEKESFELYQSTLKKIGVTLKPIATTFPAYADMLKKESTTPDLGAVYAFPLFPDPNEVLFISYDSQFRFGNGYNWGQYSNPQVDKLLESAQSISDQTKRCDLYKQAQQIITNDQVAVNVSLPQYVTVLGADVQGYKYNGAHHQTENTYDISVGG
jgi:peptide/nickel transport system substrate-binding protein